jgi:TRAP-type uncharacterized transport system substrate-binding protein
MKCRYILLCLSCIPMVVVSANAQQAVSSSSSLQNKPVLRLCTAQAGNNYHIAGQRIAMALKNVIDVKVVETKGSWENLETMSASRPRCDAILAQDDAVALHRFQNEESKLAMDRMTTLFEEKTHLLCNRKVTAKKLSDIEPGSVAIFTNEYGSGSYITWHVMSKLNPRYRAHNATEKGLDEALLSLLDNQQPACLFYVSRQGGKTLNRANQNFGDRLKLIELSDQRLEQRVDRLKRKLYRPSKIERSSYPNLMEDTIDTLSVNAVFFLNSEWKAQHPQGTKNLSDTLLDVLSEKK